MRSPNAALSGARVASTICQHGGGDVVRGRAGGEGEVGGLQVRQRVDVGVAEGLHAPGRLKGGAVRGGDLVHVEELQKRGRDGGVEGGDERGRVVELDVGGGQVSDGDGARVEVHEVRKRLVQRLGRRAAVDRSQLAPSKIAGR